MKYILYLFLFLYGGFCRRWIGGGFQKLSKKRLVAMFFWFLSGCLCLLIKITNFINYLKINYFISLVFYCLVWWGHGGFFRVVDTTEKIRKNKVIDFIIEKIFKKNQFSILANYVGLSIGYVFYCGLVGVFIKKYCFCLVGLVISTIYLILGLIWKIYYKNDKYIKDIINNKKTWDYSKVAEFFCGGVVCLLYYLFL